MKASVAGVQRQKQAVTSDAERGLVERGVEVNGWATGFQEATESSALDEVDGGSKQWQIHRFEGYIGKNGSTGERMWNTRKFLNDLQFRTWAGWLLALLQAEYSSPLGAQPREQEDLRIRVGCEENPFYRLFHAGPGWAELKLHRGEFASSHRVGESKGEVCGGLLSSEFLPVKVFYFSIGAWGQARGHPRSWIPQRHRLEVPHRCTDFQGWDRVLNEFKAVTKCKGWGEERIRMLVFWIKTAEWFFGGRLEREMLKLSVVK